MWMTASNEIICFLAWLLPEAATGMLCDCLVGTLPHTPYVISSLLRGVKVRHPAQYDLTRPPYWLPTTQKTIKKTVPWLPSSRSEGRVFQHRCQPTSFGRGGGVASGGGGGGGRREG